MRIDEAKEVQRLESDVSVKFKWDSDMKEEPRISTGLKSLDYIMDGGYPVGRIIEIFGGAETGKSTLLYESIVSVCKSKIKTLFVDGERAYNPTYIRSLGLPPKSLYVVKPHHGEQAFQAMNGAIKNLGIKFIGLDSVTGLIPEQQYIDNTKNPIGMQARLLSNEVKILVETLDENDAICVVINQTRTHFKGVMVWEDTTGGNALKFYSSIRIGLSPVKVTPDSRYTKVLVRKNKTGAPLRETVIRVLYGQGIDKDYDLFQWGILTGAVKHKPKGNDKAWYEYNGKLHRWKTIATLLKGETPTTEHEEEEEGAVPMEGEVPDMSKAMEPKEKPVTPPAEIKDESQVKAEEKSPEGEKKDEGERPKARRGRKARSQQGE